VRDELGTSAAKKRRQGDITDKRLRKAGVGSKGGKATFRKARAGANEGGLGGVYISEAKIRICKS
jgi:hypothetical protein